MINALTIQYCVYVLLSSTYIELLYMLCTDLISRYPCITKVQKQAKDCVISFISLKSKCEGYQPDKVIPYMHIMALHMPEVIRRHKNLVVRVQTNNYKIFTWFLHKYRHRKEEQ